jgi:hypothetical protein
MPDERAAGSADDSWDAVRRNAEPIVAELDSPDETLLDLRVVIPGDDTVSCSAEFTRSASPQQRVALLRYAIKLVEDTAARTERFEGP